MLLYQNSRFTDQKHERTVKTSISPIETRTNGEKLQLTEQEPKRMEKNFNSPNKTRTNGGKPQTTDRKLKRTVKNADTPNENSNERWKTPKMVAPAHNHTRISETSRTHDVDGKHALHGPHGGRLMILPVDSSARVLPRQRYLLSISFAPR